ncbi:MAG: SRPBCC domain-containing protein [Saprospiraceae bacterium]|nr:SRPBCC domain-containing protein [Saprospiraceae bacterium]
MKRTDPPVVVTQEFQVSKEILWEVLVEPDEMRKWFFDNIPDFKPEVGFQTQFPVSSEGRTFTHLWKVVKSEPLRTLVVNWKFSEYPGDSNVHFIINETETACILTLKDEVLEDFPQDIPEFKRESCLGGWNYFIKDRLKNYLLEETD